MTDELTDQMIAKTEGFVQAKKGEQAVESANELAEVDPKDAIVWYLKGKAHYVSGEYDDALAALSKAATLQADKPDIWLVMGYTLIALRRYTEALPSLEYVKGVDANSVEATTALCVLHTILGNASAAKTCFEQGMQINPKGTAFMLAHFYSEFFASSPAVGDESKAEIEKLLEAARLAK